MIGETILAEKSARCQQAYNWRDNISPIIGLQSASWWLINIYSADYWATIGALIIVPPTLARSSAVSFNSANPTWAGLWHSIYFSVPLKVTSRQYWKLLVFIPFIPLPLCFFSFFYFFKPFHQLPEGSDGKWCVWCTSHGVCFNPGKRLQRHRRWKR